MAVGFLGGGGGTKGDPKYLTEIITDYCYTLCKPIFTLGGKDAVFGYFCIKNVMIDKLFKAGTQNLNKLRTYCYERFP